MGVADSTMNSIMKVTSISVGSPRKSPGKPRSSQIDMTEIDLESQLPMSVIMAGSPIPSPRYTDCFWSPRPFWIDDVPEAPVTTQASKKLEIGKPPLATKVQLGIPKKTLQSPRTLSAMRQFSPRDAPAPKISPRSVCIDMSTLLVEQIRQKRKWSKIPFIQE